MIRVNRYVLELTSSLVVYAGLLVVSLTLLRQGSVGEAWRVPVSLLPIAGGLVAAWAILRQLGRLDEYQRRLQLDGLALAFLGTAVLTFSYGFLENAGMPRLSMFTVWPLMAGLWVIGTVAASRRYRR